MSTLIHNPQRDCVSSLGIPVDDLTLEDAIAKITEMAKTRGGRSRLVSTLNVDFLVNCLGTRFSRARHPELLSVLRDADLVTADGFPILWLSSIVGKPLRQRVCGSDLVPGLAARAAREGLSIFLLGGSGGVAEAAADKLKGWYPGLRIAGVAAPFIHTHGPELANCVEDDAVIADLINQSRADILLVGLGNPKQELWFNRNRNKLQVPVTIGVGGTFEFITGNIKRAPLWLQRLNLEWAFRITQDPARLWARYAKGLIKLGLLTAPLLVARVSEMMAFAGRRVATPESLRWRSIWSARDQSLDVLRLPPLVTRQYLVALVESIIAQPSDTTLRLLDFSAVKKVQMSGHQALLSLAELQQREDHNLLLLGIPAGLRRDLCRTRVLDALQTEEGDTLEALGSHGASCGARFSCRSFVMKDSALIFLGGKVTEKDLSHMGFVECLSQTARDRDCIVDLRNVSLLESSAIVALKPFLCSEPGQPGRVLFSGARVGVMQMFRMAGLGSPEHFLSDQGLFSAICDAH
ncbi:WecB/TagA/CpsF family glycosyltransferase [Pseudomaricurvus alkylphenolicus]|jgi:N-acetylglucosaminyldiphosphoundecaprenol N-acetyl-beta-D-mannosaminyltransferase|uniref:WecB/TagA/CpsF family glycosyltransferase n=1 Tax=Pseudomaricurvus alkylphenolicus TaxID=1306991 RepID=UPI001422C60F|nr:WecB/TagA/CpsF family glycosyltransferase [Pseudomaricurvus alkylphenolicus]NIB39714.1 WecB/TagA/CpsF family glycosyltransferase [Pseudomaricurvus alkylphenolicus]